MPRVDVVIVNWNAGPRLRRCVAALGSGLGADDLNVIVVDNASSDGSAERLDAGGAALTLLRNRENLGFGRACNQGAAVGTASSVLFLNPDTVATPRSVLGAAAALAQEPRIGIVGARLTDESGATQRSTARRPSPLSLLGQSIGLDRIAPRLCPPLFVTDWDHAATRDVEQVMGAFLMIRRDLFEHLDGFDPRFFVYFEDVDLCARAREAGFRVVHLAEHPVIHEGQGTTRQVKDRRLFFFLRSKALFVRKHHGRAAAIRQLAVDLLLHVPLRTAAALGAARLPDAIASLRAGAMLTRALPQVLDRGSGGQVRPRGGPSRPASPSATPRSSARSTERRPPDATQ